MRPKKVSAERQSFLRDLAEQLADDFFPDSRVGPQHIIDSEGLTCSFGDYGDYFDGMLECRGGRFHVYCNVSRTFGSDTPRARFTLAHELGHYFIDEHRHALIDGSGQHLSKCEFESINLIEQEADLFASCLLLPPERFRRAARTAGRGLPGILGLSETFGSSVTATAIRYVQEDFAPCAAIKWSPDSYSWKWLSQKAREDGYRKTIESLAGCGRTTSAGVDPGF